MAQDPRDFTKFTVKNCPKNTRQRIVEDQNKKDFFSDLGKIGNIEVLNRFGGGKITSGLRSLSKISDSIRTGDTNSAIIPNDAGYVFETIGINANAAQSAGQFNPSVLNRATGQAESIIGSVKAGNFKLEDIPGTFSDLQDLSSLVDGVFTDNAGNTSLKDIGVCGASPYAIDLVQFAPKYKFLFIVEIILANPYQTAFNESENSLAFVVKSSTRPNVNIEHEEINMYNFWTRIPKRTVFEPITLRFYDDNQGKAHKFYSTYLRKISPISRVGGMGKSGILSVPYLEAHSLQPNSENVISTASVGALSGTNTSMVKEMRLYHIYNYGKYATVYHFHHTKIMSMNLDELDMAESGNGSEIELQFAYDALYVTPAFSVSNKAKEITDLTGGGIGALYPIVPNLSGSEEIADGEYDDEDDDNGFGVSEPEPEEAGFFAGLGSSLFK